MAVFEQLFVNSVIAGASYVLIALGFNLFYGTTKFINFAHGVTGAAGGYVVFALANWYGWNIWVSVLVGILAASIIGYLIDRLVFRPLRGRKASNLVLFVSSLGISIVLQAALAMIFGTQFQTLQPTDWMSRVFAVNSANLSGTQLLIISCAFLASVAVSLVLARTRFGKAIQAVSDDEEVAKIMGIRTDRLIGATFLIGSALVGLAAILRGFDTGLYPAMGLLLLIEGVIACIIGGIGNVYGGIMGAFILAFAENFGIWKIASEWKPAIAFLVLVVFLIFRPEGIMKR